jgi:hypothetical protein
VNRHRVPITIFAALASGAPAACQLDAPDSGDEPTSAAASALTDDPACDLSPVVAFTPAVIPPTQVGVPVTLDVAITNPNAAGCSAKTYVLNTVGTGLLLDPRPPSPGVPPTIQEFASGATVHMAVTATAPASADGGDVIPVSIAVIDLPSVPGPIVGPLPTSSVPFTVAATPGCQVSASHELMIRELSVVDDPVRTVFDPRSRDPRNGAWTFKHLAEGMARTPADAPAMVEAMLTSLAAPQTINGLPVAARPNIQSQVLASWPRTATGALDLAKAPLHLLAIVNRFDLRDLAAGNAGEGRFVFSFDLAPQPPPAPPPQATIIFEYKLPAARERDVTDWAESFHALGRLPFGEQYNAALQAITERFVRRGARPRFPNGSAINAVRTNEIPFGNDGLWELREFHLSAATGRLEPATLELTPDLSFNNSATLASYIHANQARILSETHVVPRLFNGQPFQAGAVLNDLTTWTAPGVTSDLRHHFAINTCNGCHAADETGTVFLHLSPRLPGAQAQRSAWLTGTVVNDPETGALRSFDDLGRRKADMKDIVCCALSAVPLDKLSKGISRVH